MMRELLQRMAGDPLGRLPVTELTEREDRLCDFLEDRKLVKWMSSYPYGYRITAAGHDSLSVENDDSASSRADWSKPWRRMGVTLAEGTALRIVAYGGKVVMRGEVRRGGLYFGSAVWQAPSPAAEWAFARNSGVFPSLNGWDHVEALVNDEWRLRRTNSAQSRHSTWTRCRRSWAALIRCSIRSRRNRGG